MAIKEVFEKYGLSLHNLHGQGYDCAANMSGPYSGVQAMIRKENNKAIYMHCHAHILNLVLVESCSKNTIACNFFGDVQFSLKVVRSAIVFLLTCRNLNYALQNNQ